GRLAGTVWAGGRARRHGRLYVSGNCGDAPGAHRRGALASRQGPGAASEGVVDARTGCGPRRGHATGSGPIMNQARVIDCEEALRRLFEYLDAELHGELEREMAQHLERCRSCFSRVEFEKR